MDKYFHCTHYNGCNYLYMLGLKLNYVSKRCRSYFDQWFEVFPKLVVDDLLQVFPKLVIEDLLHHAIHQLRLMVDFLGDKHPPAFFLCYRKSNLIEHYVTQYLLYTPYNMLLHFPYTKKWILLFHLPSRASGVYSWYCIFCHSVLPKLFMAPIQMAILRRFG